MIKKILISIIIPVFNSERYVTEAIESIYLQNCHYSLEIIVVDDGSTDNSSSNVKSFSHVQYVYQKNQGVAAARNTGLNAARGEYIAFLDADDIWPADKLSVQYTYHMEHPDVDLTYGKQMNYRDEDSHYMPRREHVLLEQEKYHFMSLFTRKEIFQRVGHFNTEYKVGSDFEWYTRARERGLVIKRLEQVLVYRRIHGSNLSINAKERYDAMFKMLRASMKRKQ